MRARILFLVLATLLLGTLSTRTAQATGNHCHHGSSCNSGGGSNGQNGNNGQNGQNGANGQNGQNGQNGVNGQNGANGQNGQNGQNGANGQNGSNGQNGANGQNGSNGQNGDNGLNGANGQNGANGENGQNGQNGENGQDGRDGRDGRATEIPVMTAYAAPVIATEDTCMGSSSVGAQSMAFGLSVGTTWRDENCQRLKNSRELNAMGFNGAAVALLCVDDDVRDAMTTAGTPCPGATQSAAAQPERRRGFFNR
jgi:hypothetical protein